MLGVRCLRRQQLDAHHFRQLAQHLFHVDRHEKEAVDINVLQSLKCIFGLLHGDAKRESHVTGIFGATSYVDRVFDG